MHHERSAVQVCCDAMLRLLISTHAERGRETIEMVFPQFTGALTGYLFLFLMKCGLYVAFMVDLFAIDNFEPDSVSDAR